MTLDKTLLESALQWFQPEFRQKLVSPVEGHFPNAPLPVEIRRVLDGTEQLLSDISGWPGDQLPTPIVAEKLNGINPNFHALMVQILLLYRRWRAAEAERLTEKTIHLELITTLERDVRALDALVAEEWFQKIEPAALPRLSDYFPVQYFESATPRPLTLQPRQHDEKFHTLQAPSLFLPDLAYFRAKCEERDAPIAIGFMDIDNFKRFNTDYTETRVDRNLLPRFMQAIEAHVYQHGYAYRQGGDEYLILLPGLSRKLSVAFLEELRLKIAGLTYPDIAEKATVSIGLCVVEPDCSLTDRELLDRANAAKKFAKESKKNCIAAYSGRGFLSEDLYVVKS